RLRHAVRGIARCSHIRVSGRRCLERSPPSGPLTAGKRTACRGTHADLTLRPPPRLGHPPWPRLGHPPRPAPPLGHPRRPGPSTPRWRPRVGTPTSTSFGRRRLDTRLAPFVRRLDTHLEGGGWRAVDGGRWMGHPPLRWVPRTPTRPARS